MSPIGQDDGIRSIEWVGDYGDHGPIVDNSWKGNTSTPLRTRAIRLWSSIVTLQTLSHPLYRFVSRSMVIW
jgi:hypothetical protein